MQGEWAGETVGPDVWETCRELIPAGSVFAFLAEHREVLFPAGMFADMYPSSNGRPSLPPQVLAATVVLQSLHGLSDFEVVQELRCDLRWKAACGLGLHDTAFDPSLLTYFRRRLRNSADPTRIFTTVKEVVAATGVLKGKHRRALDSTVLDDAVATQDTVTQIISAIRRVIREVPGGQETAASWCTAHDYTDPGKPRIAWDDETARAALVDALVTDALNLLGHLPEQELGDKAANAVGLLALVAGQDVEPAEDSDGRDGRWRIAKRTAPDRTVSTVDPDARHIHKNRTRHQDGFKGHVSFEPETGLFTAVALTGGYGSDNHEAAVAAGLLADEEEGTELTVLGDSAYGSGELREHLQDQGHTLVIKPPPIRTAVPGGFTIDDFHLDLTAGTATCPAGHTANLGQVKADGARTAQFKRLCTGCPLRERCTTSKTGRTVNVHPQHELLTAARAQAATDVAWQDEYRRWRPPVERAIAWLVAKGNRRVPHRGVIANSIWLHHRAAALNLRRLINLGLTRTSTTWHLTPATP
ncbi:IS1182 family transposase [Streptomyces sp. NBC_00347]|uniref:IS1182 family transposase n=1 Tax=Streptomyces sp. NBC_00347 TaxID=2975721 RepID=UPI00224EDB08|nr:IS1182 family transposase [Streptomyces sp. NBC_00347]MCX5126426.1 IS1182 family transposase [Streptomyces sp. NBC_00347]MCX5126942.1 IS1182 family transposase [Streptomyces sp. NBC_00347]